MPVNTAIKLAHILDISGLTLFVSSYALKFSSEKLGVFVPDVLQYIASVGAVIFIYVRIISYLLDNKSKRINNEMSQLELEMKKDEHESRRKNTKKKSSKGDS